MDPHLAYCDIVAAINARDFETARESALALRQWLDRGGFYPPGQVPASVDALLQRVLACTDGSQPDMPFTLVCQECDAGEEAGSLAEAVSLGWIDIVPASDLLQANYCGLCPACQANDG